MTPLYKKIKTDIIEPHIKQLKGLPWNNPSILARRVYLHFKRDSLYRNSIYLMLSTFILSVVGFFFWTINARLYTTEQIGLATAMISLLTLISTLSILGLNAGLIRYLPAQKNKNNFINTIFLLLGIVSLIVAVVYVMFIDTLSPKLYFIKQSPHLLFFFIAVVVISTINLVSDSVFIAYKSTKYVLIYNIFFSLTRLLLPIFFTTLGATGIFISHSMGIVVCLIMTIYFLYKKFDYKLNITLSINSLKEIGKFSLGTYFAYIIGGLPNTLFPIIVLNKLGPKVSAYYYMDMMLISFLYMIPISISQSLFAEGSHKRDNLRENIIKSAKISFLILIPAIALTIVGGKFVLLVFGTNYAEGGLGYLQIMSLSALMVPVNYILGVYLRINQKVALINGVITVGTIVTLSLSFITVSYLGIYGIALGLISGQIIQAVLYISYIFLREIKKG